MDIKMEWNFDEDGFKREVKKNLEREYERKLNRLAKTHKGRDADEIERAILRELDLEGDLPEGWVEAVQLGRNITVDVTWD